MYKNIFVILNIVISLVLAILFSNFAVIIINLIILLLLLNMLKKEKKDIYLHLIIIYSICIIAMLLLYFGYVAKYGQPYYLGGSDDSNFEIWANKAIKSNNYTLNDVVQNQEFKYYNCNGFIWLLSIIIRFCNWFGGYHTIILRLINTYLLIFIGILAFKYFNKEVRENSKKNIYILYVTILFPNALYVSIHGFRDTVFAFIIFSIFYLTNYIKEQKKTTKILSIIYIILMAYLAYYIREVAIIYIGLSIILNIILDKKITNKKNLFIFLLVCIICILLAIKFNLLGKLTKYLDRYNEYILGDAEGLASYVFSTPLFPIGIILRIIYGSIFPSPTGLLLNNFDIDSICKFIISIGTIFQIYMLPYLFKNIKKIDNIFIMYIIMFFSIILTTFNFRHFITLYPFMFILMGRQFINTEKQYRKKYANIMTVFILLGTGILLLNEVI